MHAGERLEEAGEKVLSASHEKSLERPNLPTPAPGRLA